MVSLKVLFDEAMKNQRKKDAVKRDSSRMSHNKTGFKWLCKTPHPRYKDGYCWRYQRTINRESVSINASDLYRLFDKVKSKGYPWIILDEDKAQRTVESEDLIFKDYLEYMKCNGGYVDYTDDFRLVVSK